MKKVFGMILWLSLTCSAYANVSPETQAEEELISVMDIERQMLGGFDAMLPMIDQLSENLQLNDSEKIELTDIYRDWFNNSFDRKKMKSMIINIYSETFSQEELEDMIQFYKTPTGKKVLEKLPGLSKAAMQFGMAEAQDKQSLLIEKLTPFIESHQSKYE
ncbi:hypothetical protein CSW98_10505 [Vibrio sp. HA2012]|uniref:DUF2059 domain-containing protein n=1 Tax=Vibrio sp. HA2012 TaxID=1971595 RepID=UPI000C2BAADE|nr:DUF2059 domain-containing protein [Vibrio sp. HA2012]PJC86021.1 hypothetical protein CSW98_10505 [Vibrio sp. HA2012]